VFNAKGIFQGTLKLLHITTMSVFTDLFAELGMNQGLQQHVKAIKQGNFI
jgi:hypothetical protein